MPRLPSPAFSSPHDHTFAPSFAVLNIAARSSWLAQRGSVLLSRLQRPANRRSHTISRFICSKRTQRGSFILVFPPEHRTRFAGKPRILNFYFMKTPTEKTKELKEAGVIRLQVCEGYDITIHDLFHGGRKFSKERQIICFLLRRIKELPYQQIAAMTGSKAPGSARDAEQTVRDQMDVYPIFKREVEEMEKICRRAIGKEENKCLALS